MARFASHPNQSPRLEAGWLLEGAGWAQGAGIGSGIRVVAKLVPHPQSAPRGDSGGTAQETAHARSRGRLPFVTFRCASPADAWKTAAPYRRGHRAGLA